MCEALAEECRSGLGCNIPNFAREPSDKSLRNQPLLSFMCILTAAFACRPLDNIMIFLLKDDRFLKHREHLWSKMHADIADVTAYSDAFFDEVASMAGISASVSGKKLRSEVLLSMHISASFIYREAFILTEAYPFSLTQGDIERNVRELAAWPAVPQEPIAAQLWNCLHSGVACGTVVRAVKLMLDATCSTGLAEKGHGQAAYQMRHHPMLNKDNLCSRSLTAESRALSASGCCSSTSLGKL